MATALRLPKPDDCEECPMYEIGSGFLPDLIPPRPLALFVGEAGGEDETVYSRPFCGGAGNYMVALLRRSGWIGALTQAEREDATGVPFRLLKHARIGLGNILRCRPPRNKYPTGKIKTGAEAACRTYDGQTWQAGRMQDVDFSELKVIITLGDKSFKAISGQKLGGVTLWQNSVIPHRYVGEPMRDPWLPPEKPWSFPTKLVSWRPGIEKTPAWPVYDPARVWLIPALHPAALMRSPDGWPSTIAALERAKKVVEDGWAIPQARLIRLDTRAGVETVLRDLTARSKKTGRIVFSDIENPKGLIVCISFCLDPPTSYVLPIYHVTGEPYWDKGDMPKIVAALREFYENAPCGFQHGMHDVSYIEPQVGCIVKNWVADTCYLHAQAYSELPHNLAFLQATFTDLPQHKTLVRGEAQEAK